MNDEKDPIRRETPVSTRRGTYGYLLVIAAVLLFLALLVSALSYDYLGLELLPIGFAVDGDTPGKLFLVLGLTFLLIILAPHLPLFRVDPELRTLERRVIFRRQSWRFDELDGIVSSVIRRERSFTRYRVFYLLKEGRVIGRVDSFFCSNHHEVRQALMALPYLGSVKMTAALKLELFFSGRIKIH
ncbi:MAG: hypothetical protein EOO16_22020 [Chitinophagaceae bacterium]|nr:MAG: hypothetical protein EOO16_22020 [Chitinophagaceae bacterium]